MVLSLDTVGAIRPISLTAINFRKLTLTFGAASGKMGRRLGRCVRGSDELNGGHEQPNSPATELESILPFRCPLVDQNRPPWRRCRSSRLTHSGPEQLQHASNVGDPPVTKPSLQCVLRPVAKVVALLSTLHR